MAGTLLLFFGGDDNGGDGGGGESIGDGGSGADILRNCTCTGTSTAGGSSTTGAIT
jgi:hypothetical protein